MSIIDLDQLHTQLPTFIEEGRTLLLELAEASELEAPKDVLSKAEALSTLLYTVDAELRDAYLEDEDRDWMVPRLGYAIGQYFVLDHHGRWGLNSQPNSPQYGHYVVLVPSPSDEYKVYPVDTFEAAYEYVYQEPDRDLVGLLEEIVGLLI